MKKVVCLALMFTLVICSCSLVSFAEGSDEGYTYFDESGVTEEDPIRYDLIGPQPRMTYVTNAFVDFGYDGTNAVCYVYVSGKSNCTKISGDLILYQKIGSNYSEISRWGDMSTTTGTLSRERTKKVSRGYTYKLVFDGTAYGTSGSEPLYIVATSEI